MRAPIAKPTREPARPRPWNPANPPRCPSAAGVKPSAWKERGRGDLHVNLSKGGGAARLVMRAKGHLRLILNAKIFPGMVRGGGGGHSGKSTHPPHSSACGAFWLRAPWTPHFVSAQSVKEMDGGKGVTFACLNAAEVPGGTLCLAWFRAPKLKEASLTAVLPPLAG